jgi:RNA polymerase sigma-70 factor (ECF subfamily)
VSATAVKVALHRLRRRLGELVREQVLATLADPGELEEELGRLLEALAQRGRRAGPL